MARIRSVKPELRRDLTVAEWPRETRYAWVLLWGYLDDHGRGLDDLRLLTADLFPLDRDVTEKKLDRWLELMASESRHGSPTICRYEVGGRRFLHAPKWVKSQRVSHPQDSTLPPCPTHDSRGNDSGTIPESVRNDSATASEPFQTSRTPEDLGVRSKGAREQGSKGVAPLGTVPETPPPPASKGTRIPDTWPLNTDHAAKLGTWADEHAPAVARRVETDNWQDWHRAKGDTAKDWTASWRTWMRRAQTDAERGGRSGSSLALVRHGSTRPSASEAAANAALEAGARVAARHAAQEGA